MAKKENEIRLVELGIVDSGFMFEFSELFKVFLSKVFLSNMSWAGLFRFLIVEEGFLRT